MKKYLLLIIIIFIAIFYLKFSSNNYQNKKVDNLEIKENIKTKNNKNAKLTLVGDLLFEQPFYDAIANGDDKEEYFSLIKDYFQKDDLTIGNMEVVIGNSELKSSGVGYNFCAPEYIGNLVSSLDFEVLGTANNHAFDRGVKGINSTIDYFKNNSDFLTVGTYKSSERPLHILEINGIKFGFLAYTYGTNQKPNIEESLLINYYKDINNKEIKKELLKEDISKLKEQSDVVIVLMHWGNEFTYTPNNEQKELAKYLNELGVNIIVGSHSHSIQPIEIIDDKYKTLVYYSLGNFVSADDDIARTPKGVEEFDNAYQFGLLSTLDVILDENNKVDLENIKTNIIVNYFDKNMRNFKLMPFNDYNDTYEKTHYRYSYGLTREFIKKTYEEVINSEFR